MDVAEVGDVEEIFDDARAGGVEEVGSGEDDSEGGVFGVGEVGDVGEGFAEADPDDAIALADAVGLGLSFGWWRLGGMSRDEDALAGGAVVPGVVGADKAIAFWA